MNTDIIQSIQTATLVVKSSLFTERPLTHYFLAKDVAEIIEHQQVSRMVELVEDDEKLRLKHLRSKSWDGFSRSRACTWVCWCKVGKPIAKQFKKGVKAILKEIRTKGATFDDRHGHARDDNGESGFAKYRKR